MKVHAGSNTNLGMSFQGLSHSVLHVLRFRARSLDSSCTADGAAEARRRSPGHGLLAERRGTSDTL